MTMPDYTDEQLLSYRSHDFTDPLGKLNEVETVFAAVTSMPACPHCHVTYRPFPGPGISWGIEHVHETGCPVLLDLETQPAVEVNITDDMNGE